MLVDDHEVVRHGLRTLLEAQDGLTICGETGDGRTAIELARQLQPDIVVMDIRLPELNGFEATRRLRTISPKSQVLILSMHESEQMVREVIAAGAQGYVLKSDAGRDLVHAVQTLRRGETFFSQRIAHQARGVSTRDLAASRKRRGRSGELTPREREILQLLAEGKSNKRVANALGISVKTAETHRARVMRKLQVESLAELVRYAIRNGIIEV